MYTIFDDIQQLLTRLARRLFRPRVLEPREMAILRGYALAELDDVAGPVASGSSTAGSGR
jgi:hypothetical protein